MVQTPKKKYEKPVLIDLSIEGVTGIGAPTCNNGPGVASGSCAGGTGASSDCSLVGAGVTAACTTGNYPYETGTLCSTQGVSASSCYANGSSASQGLSRCIANGSSATYATPNCCNFNGNTDTRLCYTGSGHYPAAGGS